jgi:cytochrome b561
MLLRNTINRYGLIAIFFHWLMAILLIGLLILGLYMTGLPISLQKLKLYGWHKEYGLLALWLAILRLAWRFINTTPYLDLPLWERLAARAVHWSFYAFMFLMPITGWLITSAAGLPASFFGLFVLPDLVSPNEQLRLLFQDIHRWLGYALIVFICMHTSAALKHHFIDKDDILRRMFK